MVKGLVSKTSSTMGKILNEIVIRIVANLHLRVQSLFYSLLPGLLNSTMKSVDLLKCLIELHLKIVPLENDRLEMQLLSANHVLRQLLLGFLDLSDPIEL